jgi:hypothetical protein
LQSNSRWCLNQLLSLSSDTARRIVSAVKQK